MIVTPFDADSASARPLWLTTLADLGLLLVGFFVFLQASTHLDPAVLSAGIRSGFGVAAGSPAADPPPETSEPAMSQELGQVVGFAPGGADTREMDSAVRWVRGAAADPRTRVRIAAGTDGGAGDVDRATGSGAVLAADRGRAVAVALVKGGAVSPDRIEFAGAEDAPHGRRVLIAIGFAGERSDAAPPAGN